MRMGWIRHGKTEWNALGKIQGQTDIPLSDEGIHQAKALASRLYNDPLHWDAVVSSDLLRARKTAQIIAEQLDIPLLEPDPRIRERSFGEIEGTTEQERLARWGEAWRHTYEGQESDDAVKERGQSFVHDWVRRGELPSLLIVTHGSFLAQILHMLCEGLDQSYLNNLSYSIVEHREGRWHSVLHNCTRHLN